jgi:hypothetical protein
MKFFHSMSSLLVSTRSILAFCPPPRSQIITWRPFAGAEADHMPTFRTHNLKMPLTGNIICRVASRRNVSCAKGRTINTSYVFLRTQCWGTKVQKIWSWRTDTSQAGFSRAWIFVFLSSYFCTTLAQYPKTLWATYSPLPPHINPILYICDK